VDSINTNVANINTNLLSLQLYINAPPATFNIYNRYFFKLFYVKYDFL
jgi:hypothetical protein